MNVIVCQLCIIRPWLVSEEDPDSTMADAISHLERHHPGADPAKDLKLEVRP